MVVNAGGSAASAEIQKHGTGGPGTGIFWPANTSLAFTTNGTEAMRIISGGNVGIGTTSPNALLDIGNQGTTLGTLRLESSAAYYTQIQPSASQTASWTMTLPVTAGTNTYVLQTDGSGVTSWVSAAASFTGLTTGDLCTATSGAAISCAATLTGDVTSSGGTATVTTVAKIQGTTVSGTTGTTNVVFSASPTLTGTTLGANPGLFNAGV